MAGQQLTSAERALALLREAVAQSPADETAITWTESWRSTARSRGGTGDRPPRHHGQLQVRVLEAGRMGSYRLEQAAPPPSELASAVRQAMAQARGSERLPQGTTLSPSDQGRPVSASPNHGGAPQLHDPRLVELTPEEAQQRLRELVRDGETARLAWSETALAVVTSGGLSRQLRVTAVAAEVRCGRHPGAGQAAGAARSWEGLALPSLLARARRRDASGEPGDWSPPAAVVLAPEAMAALVATFGSHGLAAAAWEGELSFGRRHRGTRVLASGLTLIEDGARLDGLAFPLEPSGASRRAATLVEDGVLCGPVADPLEALRLGVPATRPDLTAEEGLPEHLFALPGGVADDDLLAAAGDGVFISQLDPVECWDPSRLCARAVARGVQRIERGAVAAALPDVSWELEVPLALAALRALGSEVIVVEGGPGSLGGTSAPAALLTAVGDWQPL